VWVPCSFKQKLTLVVVGVASASFSLSQSPTASPSAPAQATTPPPPPPLTIQIKKTIVFLETDCLHNFGPDAQNLPMNAVLQMPPERQGQLLNQLISITDKLRQVKSALPKLSLDEVAHLQSPPNIPPDQVANEIEWRIQVILKMTQFTDGEIAAFSDDELKLLPLDNARGTGFLVGYPDTRLKPQGTAFRYLITNRHVAQPGIEKGMPCRAVSSYLLLNHKPDASHSNTYTESNRIDKILHWTFPDDPSVDLAATGLGFPDGIYDHIVILTAQFVPEDDIKNHKVVEGDPVLFAGLFIQTFDQVHTLEPILRSGSLAMVPEELLPTTLNNQLGRVYLADAHAFGGNSGSPVFVDPDKYSGALYTIPRLELLGVLSGEYFENSDLTLSVATSISGNIAANSGVSIVVPASELLRLLDSPLLKDERDHAVAAQK
jgi:hypothetical protein